MAHKACFLSNLVPVEFEFEIVNSTNILQADVFGNFFWQKNTNTNCKQRNAGQYKYEKATHKMLMKWTPSVDPKQCRKGRFKINEYLIYKSKHRKVKNCNIFDITTTFKPELSKHILQ